VAACEQCGQHQIDRVALADDLSSDFGADAVGGGA
jgi:hypothetical protein